MNKRALITGVTGQDGGYLSQLLLDKGYEVFGTVRRGGSNKLQRLQYLNLIDKIKLVDSDLLEISNIHNLIKEIKPTEIYNLAGQSFVPTSWNVPLLTVDTNGMSVLRILDAITSIDKNIKFYQASTSEMYGKAVETPQNENTRFYPRSPYGAAKVFGHYITVNYRESFGIHACSGILFNHESPLRGHEFVTKKITKALAMIKNNEKQELLIGNVDAKRDWGAAEDYVEAMHLMLNNNVASDYVVATGELHSVREFLDLSLNYLQFDYEWEGEGLNTKIIDKNKNRIIVRVDKEFFRPAEVDLLLGDPKKIKNELDWQPKLNFENIVNNMIKFEIDNPGLDF